jgi:hypothetical protein
MKDYQAKLCYKSEFGHSFFKVSTLTRTKLKKYKKEVSKDIRESAERMEAHLNSRRKLAN